jgi:Flp pilus assembly protein TadB
VFRRKSSEPAATPEAPAADSSAAAVQGKGAPTPTRKEAEAARKARLQGTSDPKAARKAAREADRQARYEARLALQRGDEKRLPPRDAGPVKAYVRDYVDARRSAGELFIPVALVVLVAGFIRIQWVQVALLYAWSAMLIGVVMDSLYLIWRLRKELPARFPDEVRRGAVSYGVLRSLQIRRLRLPPPRVKANGQPVVPKTK